MTTEHAEQSAEAGEKSSFLLQQTGNRLSCPGTALSDHLDCSRNQNTVGYKRCFTIYLLT